MKNLFRPTLILFALVLSIVSCDNIDTDGFEPNLTSGWVEFETDSLQVLNDVGSLNIGMEYNVPVNREDTTITYSVEVVDGSAPGVETGTFTAIVPAKTLDLSINYDVDPTITSSYTLLFTIVSSSNPDLIIGLDGDNPDKLVIQVCANNFPLNWSGVAFIGDAPINNFDMTLTPTDTEGVYAISSAWGTNFVAAATGDPSFDGQFIYAGTLSLLSDNTLSIVGDDTNFFPGTVANDSALNGNLFDPCTQQMFYTLEQGLFNGDFVVDVILTPTP